MDAHNRTGIKCAFTTLRPKRKKMKTALITGGSKGIGFGIAESLVKDGWHVAITGRNQSSLDEAVNTLKGLNQDRVIGILADVRNYDQQLSAVEQVLKTWGQLNVL
ncbi:MAG: hypothetical protein RI909_2369, partial [Bacteroidota bacterium]